MSEAADVYVTRMYFLGRAAGMPPVQSIVGFPEYAALRPRPDGEALPPGMIRNPEKYWPYSLRLRGLGC